MELPDFTPPSKIYGSATNDSEWEVTIPAAEEEDVQKDKGLICLNIYFAWAPQRAAWRDFRDGREWKCLTAIRQKRGRSKGGRIRTRERSWGRAVVGLGYQDERSLADEEQIEGKLKGG